MRVSCYGGELCLKCYWLVLFSWENANLILYLGSIVSRADACLSCLFSIAMEVTWQSIFIVSLLQNKWLKAQNLCCTVFAKAQKKNRTFTPYLSIALGCLLTCRTGLAFKGLSSAFL